jgi:hypothetical protein
MSAGEELLEIAADRQDTAWLTAGPHPELEFDSGKCVVRNRCHWGIVDEDAIFCDAASSKTKLL